MRQITLKPHDLVIALKFAVKRDRAFTFAALGAGLAISASETHAGVGRCQRAGLLSQDSREGISVIKPALQEFISYGVRYAFPPVLGPISRGIATAGAGPSLSRLLLLSEEGPTVWPSPEGKVRGPSLCPLYPNLPKAAESDPVLYDVLTMIDAIRIGAARDRELARTEILKAIS